MPVDPDKAFQDAIAADLLARYGSSAFAAPKVVPIPVSLSQGSERSSASQQEEERLRMRRWCIVHTTAEMHFRDYQYDKASKFYVTAASFLLGAPLPLREGSGMISKTYADSFRHNATDHAFVAMSLNGAITSRIRLKDYEGALMWSEEVDALITNVRCASTAATPLFDWFDFVIDDYQHYMQRIKALVSQSDIFLALGNTGAGVHRTWLGHTTIHSVPDHHLNSEIRLLMPMETMRKRTGLRHPDPKLVPRLAIQDPQLQVQGSWKKINSIKSGGMTSRNGFASFQWKSYFYVLGGEKNLKGPWYRDFWRINLAKLDEWQRLPAFPVSKAVTDDLVGYSMAVDESKAYLFTGRPQVDYFDLVTNAWSYIKTTYKGGGQWPYPKNRILDYTMQCVNGKLYVFGGTHSTCALGCSLFLELDIEKKVWRRISGEPVPKTASYASPGPRRFTTMWVGKDKNIIHLLYGDANRQEAAMFHQDHGALNAYGLIDFWTFDIRAEKWQRERIKGNPPSPRTEMACTYNSKLDKAIVFGGFSPTVPTAYATKDDVFTFSYYADTFMYGADPSSEAEQTSTHASPARWKQILTRGFPTYRAQAHLVSDPNTGKTFLFGGYINTQYVPSHAQHVSRSYNDLWELRMDVPGGFFEDVDLDEESRTAKAGPWQRCFGCGNAGPWRKCGGACNGRAFFCDTQCMKDGWKEHKIKHKCYKS